MTTTRLDLAERLTPLLLAQPERADDNLVLSPTSVEMVLTMLLIGAAAETKEQLRAVIGGGSDDELVAFARSEREHLLDESSPVRIVNGIFVPTSCRLRPQVVDRLRRDLGTSVSKLDFDDPAAVAEVNEWVAEATSGRILRIVSDLERSASMVLLSAIHFRADWATPFRPQSTVDKPFRLRDGTSVQRAAMQMTGEHPIWRGESWHLVDLAYEDPDYAMLIALPTEPERRMLDFRDVAAGIDQLAPARVQLQLPRFDLASEMTLSSSLRQAGVLDLFDPERADLSALSEDDLYATTMVHKACVTVDEQGTEAAAATAVPLRRGFNPSKPVPFVVDRPFWFVLRNRRTGSWLFVGRVEDPGSSSPS